MLEYLTRGYTNRRTDLYSAIGVHIKRVDVLYIEIVDFHNKEHKKLMKMQGMLVSEKK